MSALTEKGLTRERAGAFLSACVFLLCFLCFAAVFLGSLIVTGCFNAEGAARARFDNIPQNLLALMLFAAALLLFKQLVKGGPDRLNPRSVSLAVLLVVGAAGVAFALSAHPRPTGDARMVTTFADQFLSGDYTAIRDPYSFEGYLLMYPFQLGTVGYFELLFSLLGSGNLAGAAVVNALLLMAIDGALLYIAYALFASPRALLFTGVLMVLFLPSILLTGYIYGVYPGLALAMWSAALLVRFLKKGALPPLIASCLLLAAAIVIKTNFWIFAIAFAITLLLNALRTKRALPLLILPVLIALPLLFSSGVQKSYERRAGAALGPGYPGTLWLIIGLIDEGLGPGWYGSVDYSPDPAQHESVKAEARRDLLARLSEMASDPMESASFLFRKMMTLWDEPTFGTLHLNMDGYPADAPAPAAVSALRGRAGAFLSGAGKYLLPCLYGSFLMGLIPLFFAVMKRRALSAPPEAYSLLPMILLGAFLYHFVAEVKSYFAINYVLMMLPFAGYGLYLFSSGKKRAIAASGDSDGKNN